MVMSLQGQTMENVIMLRDRGGVATDTDRKESARDFWNLYRGQLHQNCACNELRLKRMTPLALDTLIFAPRSGESNGTHGGDQTNTILAAITTLRTGLSGKTHRGRFYTPAVPATETADNQNRVSSGGLAAKDTIWNDIMAEFDDAVGTSLIFALGIYSTVIGGRNPLTVAGWQAVTQYVNRPILGSQRRRREGVGA